MTHTLKTLAKSVASIKGDFAEFGVYRGQSFFPLLTIAEQQEKTCHAVDSFRGMSKPTHSDMSSHGRVSYPEGKFDVGGAVSMRKTVCGSHAVIHEGVVPAVLDKLSITLLSFVHVDLDHYEPTLAVLHWCWPRMMRESIMLCHDYFVDRDTLAAKAIEEFRREHIDDAIFCSCGVYAWFVKQDKKEPK